MDEHTKAQFVKALVMQDGLRLREAYAVMKARAGELSTMAQGDVHLTNALKSLFPIGD